MLFWGTSLDLFKFSSKGLCYISIEGEGFFNYNGERHSNSKLLGDCVSINERPKRSKASKVSKYTPEEKAERAIISTMGYYFNNLEEERERKRLHAKKRRAVKTKQQ